MSTTETEIIQGPAPESPAPQAPAPTPSAPAKPETLHETVARAAGQAASKRGLHASSQPRTDQGKFDKGPPQQNNPPIAAGNPIATPPPIVSRPPLLNGLKAELQPHWDGAAPELLNAIQERWANDQKGWEPLKGAKTQLDDLLGEFRPHENLLKSINLTPKAAVNQMMGMAHTLHNGTPADKARTIAGMMQQFGITPEHIGQVFSGQIPPQEAINPAIAQLSQQVQLLTQSQQQQNEARANAEIAEFSAKPEHKHFAAVTDQIMDLLQSPRFAAPDVAQKSGSERLQLAYDQAIWMNPEVRKLVLAEQQQAAAPAQAVIQAKQAAVQVKGAPAAAPRAKADPRDIRSVVAAAVAGVQR